jgi:3-oxoacyl-(acyl-carrier-protein) synthase
MPSSISSSPILGARQGAVAEVALLAEATFRAPLEDLPALRKAPDPSGRQAVHPSLLRHADEQTVVGLAAVLRTIGEAGLDRESFGEWAVLVAPRYHGREAFERAFPTFQAESAWGVSPHLIPAHSLHSPSGTISQALKAHGPNLGVGGTPGGELEALLYAATLLMTGSITGVWVVLTGRESSADPTVFEALALALRLAEPTWEGQRLRIAPGAVQGLGLTDPRKLGLSRWLAPGVLRVDEPRTTGAVPAPHFRPGRTNREGSK